MFYIETNHRFFLFLSAVVAGDVTAADVAGVAAGAAAVGPDALCGTAAAAWFHAVDYDVAVIAAGAAVGPDGTAAAAVAAVGPDALCGTATAWFHVVDYAC